MSHLLRVRLDPAAHRIDVVDRVSFYMPYRAPAEQVAQIVDELKAA